MAETASLNLTNDQKERIFEKIREDVMARNSFKLFLQKEFAEENFLFIEVSQFFDYHIVSWVVV
jgi:hypothetical protein